MALFTDQLGRIISLQNTPARIISVVPSQTELLYYFGLDKEVIGITKFCIHPHQWFTVKERVGGTKKLNLDKVRVLKPDLVIANKEENEEHQIRELEKEFPVWISDIASYEDALKMINAVGFITDKASKANDLITELENNFQSLATYQSKKIRAGYLIWKDPYMAVGNDTFINNMLQKGGFANVFDHLARYPQINLEQVKEANPDVLFLSTEPYPFTQKHIDELQPQLPHTKILLADGELFSWYGSRMLGAPAYFLQLRQQINSL